MAREPDPDSRPISVAELMARARELDEPSARDAGTGSEESGRRRRGGAGSVSFAELTGELPRLTDTPPEQSTSSPHPPEATESRFVPNEPTSTGPDSTRTSFPRPFPRSEPPRPAREPATFPRSEFPVGRPPERPAPRAAWSAPDRGDGATVHPPTRDLSSGAIADRFRAQRSTPGEDAVATGIIPRVEDAPADPGSAPSTGSLDSADLSHLSHAEREREFERYRNFEDIDALADPEPEPKKKRGLFGGLRREKSAPVADETDDRPEPIDESRGEQAETAKWDSASWSQWRDDDASATTDPAGRYGASDLRDHLRDSSDFDFADVEREVAEPEVAETKAVPVPDTGRRRRDEEADTQVVDLDRAQIGADNEPQPDTETPRRRRALKAAASAVAADNADNADIDTGIDTAEGPSPARQWAMLGVQVVVGLLVGVGLFLGFHELWKWNVYFALVLAVVVIFGMVTTVHVVRRSQDLISTLLALGVGLIVTIGPLVLLASGS